MFYWREEMTKRVAWFTGEPSVKGRFTPYKVYEVFNEDGDSFNLKDDTGDIRFCLENGCNHICHKDWVFANVVEETAKQEIVEEDVVTTKQPKWSEWIENTTGKCPEGLKRKQKIKLKWSDGDKFVIDNPHDAAWYFSQGDNPVDITHYKVKLDTQPKLKEKKEWTINEGVCPVDKSVEVEFKRRDGDKYKDEAGECDWQLQGQDYDIIKWRLAD